jgi:hypothetical protein
LILSAVFTGFSAGVSSDTTVYLITCAPGTATYSIYGHSALRIVIPDKKSDIVYNWGVFDFDTPNFVWKFAKGRLNYKLDKSPFNSFLQEYLYEKRSVWCQKINFDRNELMKLTEMINENLKPENIYYRYDFFYDNCSTRIRDIIEKAAKNKLIYPPDVPRNMPTFRWKVGEYQKSYPWLKMGVDLIMGTPGDKKASFRDEMFLPLDLQKNLGKSVIGRDNMMVPLLQPVQTILEFDPPDVRQYFYKAPVFVFTLIFILIIFLSTMQKKQRLVHFMDIVLFSLFSALSVLMIFFNFFTDHQQMKLNINIIWFNPFIIICLIYLLLGKNGQLWFRLVFCLSAVFLPLIIFVPNSFNNSFLPLIFILTLRSSARGNYHWNPLSTDSSTGK